MTLSTATIPTVTVDNDGIEYQLSHVEQFPQQRLRRANPGETGTHFSTSSPCRIMTGQCLPAAYRRSDMRMETTVVCDHNQKLSTTVTAGLPFLAPFVLIREP